MRARVRGGLAACGRHDVTSANANSARARASDDIPLLLPARSVDILPGARGRARAAIAMRERGSELLSSRCPSASARFELFYGLVASRSARVRGGSAAGWLYIYRRDSTIFRLLYFSMMANYCGRGGGKREIEWARKIFSPSSSSSSSFPF